MFRYLASLILLIWTAPILAASGSRDRIANEAQFTALSRTVDAGRYANFPHVMFVIDRRATGGPKAHFVNSRAYEFHIDYIQKTYLSTQSVEELYQSSYFKPNRRFLLGSIVYYPSLKRYGIEFWEGDTLDPTLIETTMKTLSPLFPKPLAFKPNSQAQIEAAARVAGLSTIEGNQIFGSLASLVLNPGRATGRLVILPRLTPETIVRRGDIVVLDEAPLQMSPVAGIVTTEFSTPLAHINLLAKSWKIPNGYLKGAGETLAPLRGQLVTMIADKDTIRVRAATPAEIAAAQAGAASTAVQIARADLAFRQLPSLAEQRSTDVIRTGAKAANLGEVVAKRARLPHPDFEVPPGFSIPFIYYAEFVRANGINAKIDALLADKAALADPATRRARLAALRADFLNGRIDPQALSQFAARRDAVIGAAGVFARSSTNSEDLPGFNGAGLYTSVPNVVGNGALGNAIKTVWGSVWNEAAFNAREAAAIDHKSVMASVLIQQGMNAEASGVMITENPFDPRERGAIFINAKRGLGIRVVEGRRVAEQLLYRPDPGSVQLLTRSTDDGMLVFDETGGVKELPVEPGHAVLTDALANRLAGVATEIERMFGGKAQDIEWLAIGSTIYVVQSRPYLRGY